MLNFHSLEIAPHKPLPSFIRATSASYSRSAVFDEEMLVTRNRNSFKKMVILLVVSVVQMQAAVTVRDMDTLNSDPFVQINRQVRYV